MKKEFKFYTNLGCACSETKQIVEIDIPDNLTEEQKKELVDEKFKEWLLKVSDWYWAEL